MYLPPNFKNYHPFAYHILPVCLATFSPWWIILKQIPDIILPLNNTCFKARWSHVQWISSVQSLSRVQLFVTPWTAACQAPLSITNSWSWLKLMSIESVMSPNHLILCRPILFLPSIFPSIRVFPSESVLCIRWSKHWSFSFSVSSSNEYSGLISFRMDWLDLLAVQGTLKSLLQHHSPKCINPSFLSFLYSLTLICMHYYWKNHSFD